MPQIIFRAKTMCGFKKKFIRFYYALFPLKGLEIISSRSDTLHYKLGISFYLWFLTHSDSIHIPRNYPALVTLVAI